MSTLISKGFKMKIRIKGNSIRFGLTQIEAKTPSDIGHLEERTPFNSSTFVNLLVAQEDLDLLSASFLQNTMILNFPKKWTRKWHDNKTLGFQNVLKMQNGKELALLLEKDFACLGNTPWVTSRTTTSNRGHDHRVKISVNNEYIRLSNALFAITT